MRLEPLRDIQYCDSFVVAADVSVPDPLVLQFRIHISPEHRSPVVSVYHLQGEWLADDGDYIVE